MISGIVSYWCQMAPVPSVLQGLIQGGWIGWLATPLGCPAGVSIILFLCLSTLAEQTILVNKVYDETQINYSDRVNREKSTDI